MFDWDRFNARELVVEVNSTSEVYGFLEMAQTQGFKLCARADAYAAVFKEEHYKYFLMNHFNEIGMRRNLDVPCHIIKYSDIFSSIFPSKESLMEFLNGE